MVVAVVEDEERGLISSWRNREDPPRQASRKSEATNKNMLLITLMIIL